MPIYSVLCVVRKVFAISSILSIRGVNLYKSRSRMYWRNVSSLTRINQHRPLYFSTKGIISFIRLRNELSRRSYVFIVRRIDIFLVVRIASIARVILVSLDRTDISYIYKNGVWRKEVVI